MIFSLLAEANEVSRTDWVGWLWFVVMVLSNVTFLLAMLSIPSVLVRRMGRPQAALSWVLAMLTIPVLGLLLWWAMGRSHLERKRRKRRRASSRVSAQMSEAHDQAPPTPEAAWDLTPIDRLPAEDAEWAFSPTKGNQSQLLIDAVQT